MGTVDGPPLPQHTAGSFPTLLVERWRLVCAVSNRRGKPDNRSIPTNDAWDRVAKMLFPNDELVKTYTYDRWLIDRYRPPNDSDLNLKQAPAALMPGGITYISGPQYPDKIFPRKELIVEVEQAYFRQSLREKVNLWFTRRGFDRAQRTIPKHLFEMAVRAEFGQLPPEPVKSIEKGTAKAKPRKPKPEPEPQPEPPPESELPKKGARYTTDDDLVKEIINSLNNKKYPNRSQATWAVVPRAQGQSEQARFYRLYRKAGKVLEHAL